MISSFTNEKQLSIKLSFNQVNISWFGHLISNFFIDTCFNRGFEAEKFDKNFSMLKLPVHYHFLLCYVWHVVIG